jgi:hypothetical protein
MRGITFVRARPHRRYGAARSDRGGRYLASGDGGGQRHSQTNDTDSYLQRGPTLGNGAVPFGLPSQSLPTNKAADSQNQTRKPGSDNGPGH